MPLLSRGDVVTHNGKSWTVKGKLGEGQFAEVYHVQSSDDTAKRCAIKIEKSVRILKGEHKALVALQHVPQVCRLLEYGNHGERHFLVLELLGCNIAEHRKLHGGRVSAAETKIIGRHVLDALRGIHDAGYIHRDVKPANFCMVRDHDGIKGAATWHAIDFGLARRHLDADGCAFPPRIDAAFRGSTTYASVNAHVGVDLGRRDDLWSWLYMLVELVEGGLPWRQEAAQAGEAAPTSGPAVTHHTDQKVKDMVLCHKQAAMDNAAAMSMSGSLPDWIVGIHRYLRTLSYGDAPDYPHLYSLLELTHEENEREQQRMHANELALHAAIQAAKDIEAAQLMQRPQVNGKASQERHTDGSQPSATTKQSAPLSAGHADKWSDSAFASANAQKTPTTASARLPPAGGNGAAPKAVCAATSLGLPKQEPSAASLLVESIMKSSANARRAAEVQRAARAEAAAVAQAAAAHITAADTGSGADVKQLLTSLTASLASQNLQQQGVKRAAAANGTVASHKKLKVETAQSPKVAPANATPAKVAGPQSAAGERNGTAARSPTDDGVVATAKPSVAKQTQRKAVTVAQTRTETPSAEKTRTETPTAAKEAGGTDDNKRTLRPRSTRAQMYKVDDVLSGSDEDEDMAGSSDQDASGGPHGVPVASEPSSEADSDAQGNTRQAAAPRGGANKLSCQPKTAAEPPARRRRGRPRKNPMPASPTTIPTQGPSVSPRTTRTTRATAGRTDRQTADNTLETRQLRSRTVDRSPDGRTTQPGPQTRQLRSRTVDHSTVEKGSDGKEPVRRLRSTGSLSVSREEELSKGSSGEASEQHEASGHSEDDDTPSHVLATAQPKAVEATEQPAARGGRGRGRGGRRPRGRPPLRGGRGGGRGRNRNDGSPHLAASQQQQASTAQVMHPATGLPSVQSGKGAFLAAMDEALQSLLQGSIAAGSPVALLQQLKACPAPQRLLFAAALAQSVMPGKGSPAGAANRGPSVGPHDKEDHQQDPATHVNDNPTCRAAALAPSVDVDMGELGEQTTADAVRKDWCATGPSDLCAAQAQHGVDNTATVDMAATAAKKPANAEALTAECGGSGVQQAAQLDSSIIPSAAPERSKAVVLHPMAEQAAMAATENNSDNTTMSPAAAAALPLVQPMQEGVDIEAIEADAAQCAAANTADQEHIVPAAATEVQIHSGLCGADSTEWLKALEAYVHELIMREQTAGKRVTRASAKTHP